MLSLFKKKEKEQKEQTAAAAEKQKPVKAGLPTESASWRRRTGKGRKLQGIVVSDKMKKTAIVAVSYLKLQPKYKKYYKVTKRFKAHDENNEYHVGDKVVIQETRPLSKEKRWIIISKI